MSPIGRQLRSAADASTGSLVFHLADRIVTLSSTELEQRASLAAGRLSQMGVGPGDHVALLGRNRPEWAVWAFAVWSLRAVLVPVQVPVRVTDRDAFTQRVMALLQAARCTRVVTSPEFADAVPRAWSIDWTDVGEEVMPATACLSADTPAVIQFTSGSTARPKGVVISQAALLAQLDALVVALVEERDPGDEVLLGWVPFFHDLGLVFYLALPVLRLGAGHVLPTERFARDPGEWLRLVGRVRATVTDAPQSAWAAAMSAARRSSEAPDLTSLRVAWFAAESVDPLFIDRLAEVAPSWGLDLGAVGSTYGLAEAVLGVSATPRGTGVRLIAVDPGPLSSGRVVPATTNAKRIVSSGRLFAGTRVRIVDPHARALPAGEIGEIEVAGPSTMTGYLDEPAGPSSSQQWVRTGDLGFLLDDELYVTGRSKDVLILMGQNYWPEDFEWAADRVPGVRPGRSVAFTTAESERVVLLVEPTAAEPIPGLARDVGFAVADALGATPTEVVLVPAGTIRKTTSGKKRRHAMRDLYERGQLDTRTT